MEPMSKGASILHYIYAAAIGVPSLVLLIAQIRGILLYPNMVTAVWIGVFGIGVVLGAMYLTIGAKSSSNARILLSIKIGILPVSYLVFYQVLEFLEAMVEKTFFRESSLVYYVLPFVSVVLLVISIGVLVTGLLKGPDSSGRDRELAAL